MEKIFCNGCQYAYKVKPKNPTESPCVDCCRQKCDLPDYYKPNPIRHERVLGHETKSQWPGFV